MHRSVYEATRHGPAHVAEFGLGLLTFILASTGILLLIHGADIFRPVADRADGEDVRARTAVRSRLDEPITQRGRAFDTRHGASTMQARFQMDLSRRARAIVGTNPGKRERVVFDRAISPRP